MTFWAASSLCDQWALAGTVPGDSLCGSVRSAVAMSNGSVKENDDVFPYKSHSETHRKEISNCFNY